MSAMLALLGTTIVTSPVIGLKLPFILRWRTEGNAATSSSVRMMRTGVCRRSDSSVTLSLIALSIASFGSPTHLPAIFALMRAMSSLLTNGVCPSRPGITSRLSQFCLSSARLSSGVNSLPSSSKRYPIFSNSLRTCGTKRL